MKMQDITDVEKFTTICYFCKTLLRKISSYESSNYYCSNSNCLTFLNIYQCKEKITNVYWRVSDFKINLNFPVRSIYISNRNDKLIYRLDKENVDIDITNISKFEEIIKLVNKYCNLSLFL